jgi:translation initiation factor 2A
MASPLQFAYRTQKTVGLVDADPVYTPLSGFAPPEANSRCCYYSPRGSFFAWASNVGVSIVDASLGHIICTLPLLNVYELGFSPCDSYFITWERPGKDENGDATKNLKVWRTVEDVAEGAEKQPLGQFVQKSQQGWNLQYTSDERLCARLVTNEVQFFSSDDLGRPVHRLRVEGATDFALAPGVGHTVAVFVPERKVHTVLPQGSLLAANHCHSFRVNLRLSRSSMCRTLPAPSPKRRFSRPTRSN